MTNVCRLSCNAPAQQEVRMGSGFSGRLHAAWGHYAPDILTAVVLLIVATTVSFGSSNPYYYYGSLLLIVFVVATWLEMRQHDRRLCERCVRKMPLNPSEYAKRKSRYFTVVHASEQKSKVITYMVLLVTSDLLVTLPVPVLIGWVFVAFWCAMMLSMVYLLRAYVTHLRLQPWCPWCQGGSGGDDVVAPEPTKPTGALV